MKTFKITIFFFLIITSVLDSQSQNWIWAVHMASSDNIQFNSIASDRSTGTIVGYAEISGTVNVGGRDIISKGNKDLLLVSYDNNGDTLWIRQFGWEGQDVAKDIVSDASGNFYITGSCSDSALFETTYLRTDNEDIFIAKISNSGNLLWVKNVAKGPGQDRGNDLSLTSNGEIHLVGFFNDSLFFENDTIISNGFTNNFLAAFDNSGNYDHSLQFFGTNNITRINSVSLALDEGYLISGLFADSLYFTDADMIKYGFKSRGAGKTDIFVARILPSNKFAWARTAGSSTGNDAGLDARSDSESNIYLTGYFTGDTEFDSTALLKSSTFTSAGLEDIFVSKYN